MEWLFQTENLRLRQDRESERLFKKKKKGSERRETLPLPTPWVKLPKREVRAWNLAATHAVTPPPHESGKTHLVDPHDTHTHHATPTRPYPPRDTNICFSLHTQVFNLSFKILESVLLMFGVFIYEESVLVLLLFFFLALWLSYWWVCVCLCELWLYATMQLYYIDKRESRVSRY